ncbi:hypothetical protein, partial [Escherichia coli]
LDQVIANDAAVTVLHGNLAIGELRADTGNASVYLADGALTVNTASGDTVDLEARGGNLTLGSGGISANDIYLNSNRTIDTTA